MLKSNAKQQITPACGWEKDTNHLSFNPLTLISINPKNPNPDNE